MDPYTPPKESSDSSESAYEGHILTGPPCPECGSLNTSIDSVLRSRPNILAVIMFGWFFLVVRGAFSTRKSVCLECGSIHRYKSAGSWVALVMVVIMILLIVAGYLSG